MLYHHDKINDNSRNNKVKVMLSLETIGQNSNM